MTGRSISHGKVEVVTRATRESQEIAIENLVDTLESWISQRDVTT
ncbi:hypothetical protein [Cylindrospermopsis raciborskii]